MLSQQRSWTLAYVTAMRKKIGENGGSHTNPSEVALHFHHQQIPPIATADGTRFQEEVVSDHEKHHCNDATIKAKCRSEMQNTDPLSVPLLAGIRHMKEEMFKKIGAYMLDV